MDKVYTFHLDAAERIRIEKLEMFDEFEEWQLLQNHYCLTLAKRGEGLEGIKIAQAPAAGLGGRPMPIAD